DFGARYELVFLFVKLRSLKEVRDELRIQIASEQECVVVDRRWLFAEPSHAFTNVFNGLPNSSNHDIAVSRESQLIGHFTTKLRHCSCRCDAVVRVDLPIVDTRQTFGDDVFFRESSTADELTDLTHRNPPD